MNLRARENHSFDDIAWYGSAYLVTRCVMQLPLGMLYKMYAPKTAYLKSIVIFEISSAVCGGAPNSEAVIVGRATQGFGSAVMSGVLFIAFAIDQALEGDRAMIKAKVIKQRTVAATSVFSNCTGGAMMTAIYYIPIGFQGIKGVSAVKSSEMSFLLLISLVLVSKLVGYLSPFMIAGSMLMAIGAGLLSTFTASTGHPHWIGYQVIFGLGLGCGMQQGSNDIQTVLPKSEVPSAISLLFFGHQLGGSVFFSIAQNIVSQESIKNMKAKLLEVDASMIVNAAASLL
ncbi:MFS general substrate transporter [Aspergillus steynii IBT 23096]|uniref:MFS general substrate transporter n=1 Tax=Aspergillus steynii IBT 23096 TaxID=1392250 RepID=A0A2I2GEE2_9EURO|nr:MFS general substrate transporter [Aspergillus steynii IBT 23096]PLB51268.1 MFS general substrate transporter [Aspergillus steynii IBT 23096]